MLSKKATKKKINPNNLASAHSANLLKNLISISLNASRYKSFILLKKSRKIKI